MMKLTTLGITVDEAVSADDGCRDPDDTRRLLLRGRGIRTLRGGMIGLVVMVMVLLLVLGWLVLDGRGLMRAVWLGEMEGDCGMAVLQVWKMLLEDMLGSCVHDTAGLTSIALGFRDEKTRRAKAASGVKRGS